MIDLIDCMWFDFHLNLNYLSFITSILVIYYLTFIFLFMIVITDHWSHFVIAPSFVPLYLNHRSLLGLFHKRFHEFSVGFLLCIVVTQRWYLCNLISLTDLELLRDPLEQYPLGQKSMLKWICRWMATFRSFLQYCPLSESYEDLDLVLIDLWRSSHWRVEHAVCINDTWCK